MVAGGDAGRSVKQRVKIGHDSSYESWTITPTALQPTLPQPTGAAAMHQRCCSIKGTVCPSAASALRFVLSGSDVASSHFLRRSGASARCGAARRRRRPGSNDRLVLLIPPNAVVLVALAAEQLDDLSPPRRPTVQSPRLDPVAHACRARYLLVRHILTSGSSVIGEPAQHASGRRAERTHGYLLMLRTQRTRS